MYISLYILCIYPWLCLSRSRAVQRPDASGEHCRKAATQEQVARKVLSPKLLFLGNPF